MKDDQEQQTCEFDTHYSLAVPEGPTFKEHKDRDTRRQLKRLWTADTRYLMTIAFQEMMQYSTDITNGQHNKSF